MLSVSTIHLSPVTAEYEHLPDQAVEGRRRVMTEEVQRDGVGTGPTDGGTGLYWLREGKGISGLS